MVCGRKGFRQFEETRLPLPEGHRCSNRDMCRDRIRTKIAVYDAAASADAPVPEGKSPTKIARKSPATDKFDVDDGDVQARALVQRIPLDAITARCMDCTRIWTGPNPQPSITKHEENKNHLVEVIKR